MKVDGIFDLFGFEHGKLILDGLSKELEQLLAAIDQNDPLLANYVHNAIGSTGVVGMTGLSEMLRSFEVNIPNYTFDRDYLISEVKHSIIHALNLIDTYL
jgi:hypothetical protein